MIGVLLFVLSVSASGLVVQTEYGPIQGVQQDGANMWLGKTDSSSDVVAFAVVGFKFYFYFLPFLFLAGVPFASAGRFELPQAPSKWTAPLNTTRFSAGCPQHCLLYNQTCPRQQSEHCLQLNVYVPEGVSAPLPVILYLPGGDFLQGSAMDEQFYSPAFAVHSNCVIVTTNYRLGALGFLQFENSQISPNLGLEDQLFAMQWVQRNIAQFGGNASQVTLMGQSAGATSIGFHLTNNQSDGLFHAAISESNPIGVPLKTLAEAQVEGEVFLKNLGCSDLQCVKNKSVAEILTAQVKCLFFLLHFFDCMYASFRMPPIGIFVFCIRCSSFTPGVRWWTSSRCSYCMKAKGSRFRCYTEPTPTKPMSL
jgi:carboxylesterase type B